MTTNEDKSSLEYLYQIALDSLELNIQRFDTIDSSIDRMLAWISSITIGVIAIIGSKGKIEYFHSIYFYSSIGLFLIVMGLGLFTKIRFGKYGLLSIISPTDLNNLYLDTNNTNYLREMTLSISTNVDLNQKIINRNGNILFWMSIFFICEIIFLGLWLYFLGSGGFCGLGGCGL